MAQLAQNMTALTVNIQAVQQGQQQLQQSQQENKNLTEGMQQRMEQMDQRLQAQEQALVSHSFAQPYAPSQLPPNRMLLPGQDRWQCTTPTEASQQPTTRADVAEMISQALQQKVAPVFTAAMQAVDTRLTVVEEESKG